MEELRESFQSLISEKEWLSKSVKIDSPFCLVVILVLGSVLDQCLPFVVSFYLDSAEF